MLRVHLAAEQLFMLSDLRIDGQSIRITKGLTYLRYFPIGNPFHTHIRR